MPRLLSQRRPGRRKTPPCGRAIEYRQPHSPFQKLIDAARVKRRLSGRELASQIKINGVPLSQSTLWIWLHNTNGYPHPKSFTEKHLDQLARALRLKPAAIRQALDASRHLYTDRELPMPHGPFDAFGRYIEILENDKRQNISRTYALNLARTLYAGATPMPPRSKSQGR